MKLRDTYVVHMARHKNLNGFLNFRRFWGNATVNCALGNSCVILYGKLILSLAVLQTIHHIWNLTAIFGGTDGIALGRSFENILLDGW